MYAESEPVRVSVAASDPCTLAGLTSTLTSETAIEVVEEAQRAEAEVVVLAVDGLTPDVVAGLRTAAATYGTPTVLITNNIDATGLLVAVECRVVAILRRADATRDRLERTVRAAAAGGGVMPANLLGELLSHFERLLREVLGPLGLNASGLLPREVDILRLMADGLDNAQIAKTLCYSERTVKNALAEMSSRLNLRNRPHAVAYALRAGAI